MSIRHREMCERRRFQIQTARRTVKRRPHVVTMSGGQLYSQCTSSTIIASTSLMGKWLG
ncbi:hypothetical protein SAMN02927914_00503 [Mesorhizobium qingshengii]|uniref:Uncharacterized protein n=1 Tax=Mesorhizobium qingshengii TaxID=1165689 RepID=A0A1G5VBN8_9HYPH|nr:hypothetical protein SAMN02927914_00503 [Mesorhizobium qingshengii]